MANCGTYEKGAKAKRPARISVSAVENSIAFAPCHSSSDGESSLPPTLASAERQSNATMVGMWWHKVKTSKKTRLEQLIEARDKLQRQIEILKMQPIPQRVDSLSQTPALIAELSAILAEVESELTDEQMGNSQAPS
jgi:hypothetical protein